MDKKKNKGLLWLSFFAALFLLGIFLLQRSDINIAEKIRSNKQEEEVTPPPFLPLSEETRRHIEEPVVEAEEEEPEPEPEIDTTDWQIYMNEELGFEIKFPPNWSFLEYGGATTTLLEFAPVSKGIPWGDTFLGDVVIHRDVENLLAWFEEEAKFGGTTTQNMLRELNKYTKNAWKIEHFDSEYKEVLVGEMPAITQVTKCQKDERPCYFLNFSQGYSEEWFIHKDDMVFEVGMLAAYGPYEYFDHIVSSLKFIGDEFVMLEAARNYVTENSVFGLEFDLELVKMIEGWVRFRVVPINMDIDNTMLVMEKVDGNWEFRGLGSAPPLELYEEVPELFQDLE